MHLILTGATGLVGSAVLQHMINAPSVTTVSILSRRPVPQADGHDKIKVIIHKDFNAYSSEVLEKLRGAEGCVWAQGISVTQVTKEFAPLSSSTQNVIMGF
jgi:NAD dependent epimerase/dehydratase family enzyme